MPSSGRRILRIEGTQDEQHGGGIKWSEIVSVEVIWEFDHVGDSGGAPHLTHHHQVAAPTFEVERR